MEVGRPIYLNFCTTLVAVTAPYSKLNYTLAGNVAKSRSFQTLLGSTEWLKGPAKLATHTFFSELK